MKKKSLARFLAITVMALGASVAHASKWADTAIISSTMGITQNYLCTGGADGIDLGCPTTAPYLTSGGLLGIGITPTKQLEVSGTVSATHFVGDGSGLTGIASSDRIISNTTGLTANGASSYISITNAGTTTGYFDSTGRLITPGISVTTNQLSATTAYFSGNVGVGINSPQAALDLVSTSSGGIINLMRLNNAGVGANTQVQIKFAAANTEYGNITSGYGSLKPEMSFNLPAVSKGNFIWTQVGVEKMRIDYTGAVGISTSVPSTTLHVNGTLRLADGGEACDTNRAGAIKFTGSSFYFCDGSTGWQTLASTAASGGIDRITSSTTGITANGTSTYISITNAGTTTGYFDSTGRLITPGISVTTNQLSATTGYFSGNVGVGTTPTAGYPLTVNSVMRINSVSSTYGYLRFVDSDSGYNPLNIGERSANGGVYSIVVGGGTANNNGILLDQSGQVGINTNVPMATLHVSGSFLVSTTGQTTNPSLYVSSAGNVGIGTNNPTNPLTISTTSSTPFVYSASGVSSYYKGFVDSGYGGGVQISAGTGTGGPGYLKYTPSTGNWIVSAGGGATSNIQFQITSNSQAGFSLYNVNPSTTLHVSGTLRLADGGETCDTNRAGAIKFTGSSFYFCDGTTGWQSLAATAASGGVDRIISNTTGITANGTSTYISITNAGTTTGYFDSTGRLITPGISVTTNQLSATTAYFSTNVGIGTSSPSSTLHIVGANNSTGGIMLSTSDISRLVIYPNGAYSANVQLPQSGATLGFVNSLGYSIMTLYGASQKVVIGGGITPSTTLHINGTLRLADGGEACDTNRAGAIKFTGSSFYFCDGTTGWQTLAATAASGGVDRIISSTTGLTANGSTGTVSITNGGVTTGYFDITGRLITPGISVTTNQLSATTLFTSSNTTVGGIYSTRRDSRLAVIQDALGTNAGDVVSLTTWIARDSNSDYLDTILYRTSAGTDWRSAAFQIQRQVDNSKMGYIRFGAYDVDPITMGNNGVELLRVTNKGYLGISTTAPSTTLHVSGTIRIADGGEACDSNRAGAIKYASGTFYFCDGSAAWQSFSSMASSTTVDLYNLTHVSASTTGGNLFVGDTTGAIGSITQTTVLGIGAFGNGTNSGYGNTAIGKDTLYKNTTGYYNNATGRTALYSNTTGSANTANGVATLYTNTTGANNTADGYRALLYNTTGSNNTSIGGNSLIYNTTGNNNTGTGYAVLYNNTTGSNNTVSGYASLYFASVVTNTVAMGLSSGYGVSGSTTFQNGTFIGTQSGYGITTGNSNTLVGYNAGYNVSSGSNNITLGAGTNLPDGTASNQLNIGNFLYGDISMKRLGVGVTSPSTALEVNGTVSATGLTVNGVAITGTADRITSGTATVTANQNVGATVSGTLTISGTWNQTCAAGTAFALRVNPSTGKMEMCRP